jgi:hypothetical protein
MFLRWLLIGAVSCLGLDLAPSLEGLTATGDHAGCTWCIVRNADGLAWLPAPEPDDLMVGGDAPMLPVEGRFLAADDAMPTGLDCFATEPDLVLIPAPAPETVPVLAAEPPAPAPAPDVLTADPDAAFGAMVDTMVAGFTTEPAPETSSVLVAETPAPAPAAEELIVLDPERFAFADDRDFDGLPDSLFARPEITAPAPEREEVAAVAVAEEPRGDRVSEAVKLTGQALHAWLSVLQAPAVALHEPTHSRVR